MADVEIKRKPVYTASEIAAQLQENNRDAYGKLTWENLYAGASNYAGYQSNVLRSSYKEAMTSAYDVYLKNKMQIQSSDLIGSSQRSLLQEQQDALTDAYNSYRSNLAQGEQQIAQSYQQQIADIDNALTAQAENTSKYLNYFGDYYAYLTENYGESLIDDELWNTRYGIDTEEDGQKIHRLATWEELRNKMYEETGELTRFGEDVIDQLENAQIGEIVNDELLPSWEDFLYSEDEELYEWAFNTYNPYNWTDAGVNVGSIKAMTGRLSTDQEYSFLERWGGLTSEQSEEIFGKFNDTLNEFKSFSSTDKKNDGADIIKNVADAFGNVYEFAKDLGIDAELENEFAKLGFQGGFKELQEQLKMSASGLTTGTDAFFSNLALPAMGSAVAAGAAIKGATAAGAALLGSNPVGWVASAVLAAGLAVFGIVQGSSAAHDAHKQNEKSANRAIQMYQQAVNAMTMYARNKASEAENKYKL